MTMQATIEREVSAVGIGLHSGNLIHMTLKPAPPKTGIRFVRTDLAGACVRVSSDNIDYGSLQLATTLVENGAMVQTTEHLLSACYGYGIDNLIVELDAAEVPIMDGSATPFLVLLEEAGIKRQAVPQTHLVITEPFSYRDGDKLIEVAPAADFRVTYEIDFDHPVIRRQQKSVRVDRTLYENAIAPARTFGFLEQVNALQSKGLIRGGSMDNAVVLDGDRILNGSLRFPDEFVSHKILDLIGDFAVTGYRFRGHVTAYKAGHEAHAKFLRALAKATECYRLTTYDAHEQTAMPIPVGRDAVAVV